MEGSTVIDALIGMGMPLLVALINQSHWGPRLRGFVSVIACAVVATVVEWVRGGLNWTDWRSTLVVILGSALISYQVWWKPTTIAPTIEALTTVSGPAAGTYPD